MATKPTLRRAVPKSKIKAADYNFNFDQLNDYIENGVADNAINNYEADREYSKGQWVLANTSEGKGLYESQVNGNKGNSLLDTTYWKKLVLGGALNLFDTVLKDYVLTYEESKGLALQGTYVYKEAIAGSRYGYPDFYNKVVEEYNGATQTETVNGVTIKVNSNGHKFYNIADKASIDAFYNTMGIAWFYGIDTENERIFLPRDNFFAIKGIAPVIGNGKALGFTDGTNTKYTYAARSGNNAWTAQPSFFNSAQGDVGKTTNNSCEFFSDYKYIGLSTDPTKSGIEAHLTVNEDKYLYICVGNTTNYEGVTDVVNQGMEILEQVNLGINSRLALDVSNISDVGKQEIISWTMPDYTAGINITSLPYTAPKDGLISILGRIGNGTLVLKLNNTPMMVVDSTATGVFVRDIRVKKGDVLDKLYGNGTAPYNDSSRNEYSMFYPLKGAN